MDADVEVPAAAAILMRFPDNGPAGSPRCHADHDDGRARDVCVAELRELAAWFEAGCASRSLWRRDLNVGFWWKL